MKNDCNITEPSAAKDKIPIYEMSLNIRVSWQAHSMSNKGDNGSVRTLPRRQLLSGGEETDAISGHILKHFHATLLAEYFENWGIPLCAACQKRDGKRASALPYDASLTMEKIISQCGMCDTHGFMITARKKKTDDPEEIDRPRLSKASLVDYPMALAIPETFQESDQLFTRAGESPMLIRISVRSGVYAILIRYLAAGIGADTSRWKQYLNQTQRSLRHKAILSALFDQILCPEGAKMASLLPHLTSIEGFAIIQTIVGRAVLYSPLAADFSKMVPKLIKEGRIIYSFANIADFQEIANHLLDKSYPVEIMKHT